jgi:glutamate N-acetyltransferase/amino-acid N-acetyltransferase
MGRIKLSPEGGHSLARAIMTTDMWPKEAAVSFQQNGREITIGGVAKGAGMIHPNVATMLAFITTDAQVEEGLLRRALKAAADASFNMLSIDGDTSTNDTVLLFANGAAEAGPIREGTEEAATFQEALNALSIHLAKELARNGEGASKLLEVVIEGARTVEEARMAARAIVSSNLVKSAVHGADPNWGRVLAALGRSGAEVDEAKIALYINGVCIMEEGKPIPFHKESVVALMKGSEVSLRLCLNIGEGAATAWGCDLSEEYVTFNSAYTT